MLTDILARVLIILLITPVVFVAIKTSWAFNIHRLFLIAGLFILDIIWFNLPVDVFKNSVWTWQATIIGTLWNLFFIYYLSRIPAKEFGLTTSMKTGSVKPIIMMTMVWAPALFFIFYFFYGHRVPTWEAFFYNLTMPGISEELLYRGIFLTILNRIFTVRWKFLKADIGWGLIIVTVLYALVNAVRLRDIASFQVTFDSIIFLFTIFSGFIFGYVKEKTGNLFASMACHNLWNTLVETAQAIN